VSYSERAAHDAGLVEPDHYPTCPRCGNLCGRLAVICADCGARLKPTPEDLKILREHGHTEGAGGQP
jgi:predicted amidophosphoribosyltransferase